VDSIWTKVKLPKELERQPRSMQENFGYLKAKEIRNFMFYGFEPIMKKLYGENSEFYRMCVQLIDAIKYLTTSHITDMGLNDIERDLYEFVVWYEEYFGEKELSINVHSLLHIVRVVRLWGPLWAYSMWAFEAQNGILLNFMHGTNNKGISTCTMFLASQRLKERQKSVVHPSTVAVLKSLGSTAFKRDDHIQIAPQSYVIPSKDASKAFVLIKNAIRYTSTKSGDSQGTIENEDSSGGSDYAVQFWNPESRHLSYGEVMFYQKEQDMWKAEIRLIEDGKRSKRRLKVPIHEIMCKCVVVQVEDKLYVSILTGKPYEK
jgi:hypothetical protein